MTHLCRHLIRNFDEVVRLLPERLEDEGFCIVSETDIKQKLQEALGVEHRPYRIFGACNPGIVHRALRAEPSVGVLLPCNVAVYEGDQGETVVEMMNPEQVIDREHPPAVQEAAAEAHRRLTRVLALL